MALVLSACTTIVQGQGSYDNGVKQDAPNSTLKINGSDGSAIDKLVANSLDDIIAYWTKKFPSDFGKDYKPLSGGVYSYSPKQSEQVPCIGKASEGEGNAFYCPSGDLIAYDRDFIAQLAKEYGDFIVPLVFSHEFGHLIQNRIGDPSDKSIVLETQADCFAGVFVKQTTEGTPHFKISDSDLDGVLAGYFYFRDEPGGASTQTSAHGSAFDRMNGFQEGFEEGAKACTSTFNDQRVFTEIPFTQGDQANQGNAPYKDIVGLVPDEFNKFYDAVLQGWSEVKIKASSQDGAQCDGKQNPEAVYFCPSDSTVYYDDSVAQQAYQKFGDFATVELFAIGFAQAAIDKSGEDPSGKAGFNSAVCLTGGYAGDAFKLNQQGQQTLNGSTLSAGDIDEAIALLIALKSDNSIIDTFDVNAFGRVADFRKGFELTSADRSKISGCLG